MHLLDDFSTASYASLKIQRAISVLQMGFQLACFDSLDMVINMTVVFEIDE